MSESPYTGYIEKWADLFSKLALAKIMVDNADQAVATAQIEREAAISELNLRQDAVLVALSKELSQAAPGSVWYKDGIKI